MAATGPSIAASPDHSPDDVAQIDPDHVAQIDPDDVAQVATSMSRLLRVYSRVKSQLLSRAADDVEWSAYMLIAQLVVEGPMRIGSLATCVRSDPSTVSRQVAALVRDGLVERRADPVDGRASQLVPTERARRVHADHMAVRDEHFRRMLAGWDEQDCRRLGTLLSRFTEDFDRYSPNFFTADEESR